MTSTRATYRYPSALAFSSGYEVVAKDGTVGRVVRPLFKPGENEPAFVVIRLRGLLHKRRRTIPASFVATIDDANRVVHLGVERTEIQRLPLRRAGYGSSSSDANPGKVPEPDKPGEIPVHMRSEIVDRRIKNVTHVMTLRGSFLDDDLASLSELVRAVVRAGARQLVVDVRELESLSPRCLDVLVACAERLAAEGGQLLLACLGRCSEPYDLVALDPTDRRRLHGLHAGIDHALAAGSDEGGSVRGSSVTEG